MDRRHGKRPLPPDQASGDKREDLYFPVQPSPSKSQGEEASLWPFMNQINSSNSHGGLSTSSLIEMQDDPSQKPLQKGTLVSQIHAPTFLNKKNGYIRILAFVMSLLTIIFFLHFFLIFLI